MWTSNTKGETCTTCAKFSNNMFRLDTRVNGLFLESDVWLAALLKSTVIFHGKVVFKNKVCKRPGTMTSVKIKTPECTELNKAFILLHMSSAFNF